MINTAKGPHPLRYCILLLMALYAVNPAILFAADTTKIGQERANILKKRGLQKVQVPLETITPILTIPARIHVTESKMTKKGLKNALEEINTIWWTQAGICFLFEVVGHESPLKNGFDLWFGGYLGGWNGYFVNKDEIRVVDAPDLHPAEFSSLNNAARTAAHEFGHALELSHRQNSDDNLMRSKTKGWLLNEEEILSARSTAVKFSTGTDQLSSCQTSVNTLGQ